METIKQHKRFGQEDSHLCSAGGAPVIAVHTRVEYHAVGLGGRRQTAVGSHQDPFPLDCGLTGGSQIPRYVSSYVVSQGQLYVFVRWTPHDLRTQHGFQPLNQVLLGKEWSCASYPAAC